MSLRTSRLFLPVVLSALVTLGIDHQQAPAAPLFGISIDAQIGVQGSPSQAFTVNLDPGPEVNSPPLSIVSLVGSASLSGFVRFGLIDGNIAATSIGGNEASSSFFGDWRDQLTVTSSILPLGTPALLAFTLMTNFSTVCSGGGVTQSSAHAQFSAQSQIVMSGTNLCNTAVHEGKVIDLATFVGATVLTEGQINIEGIVNFHPGTVTVDPATAFFIDPLTPGVSYVSLSGTNYRSPVPEPATLFLLASGAVGLASVAWRRYRRK